MLVTAAVLFAMALFVVGTGLAQLDLGRSVDSAGASGPAAAVPETDIGTAAVEVAPPRSPAPADGLTVVRISASSCGDRQTGSGVVVADGLILTAAHVVGDAGLVRVDAYGVTVSGEVLGVSADGRDLALVAVDTALVAPVEAGRVTRLGESVTLIGHAGGGEAVTVVGPAVGLAPSVAATVMGEAVGVDIEVDVGMSGGPALADDGTLVGIIVGAETATGTALVVAVDDLAAVGPGAMLPGVCPTTA